MELPLYHHSKISSHVSYVAQGITPDFSVFSGPCALLKFKDGNICSDFNKKTGFILHQNITHLLSCLVV